MAVRLADKIKQSNDASFFLVDAKDVEMSSGDSLETVILAAIQKINSVFDLASNIKYIVKNTYAELQDVILSELSQGLYIYLVISDENYPREDSEGEYYRTLYLYNTDDTDGLVFIGKLNFSEKMIESVVTESITTAINGLSTVAKTGSYNDLTDKPDLSNIGGGSSEESNIVFETITESLTSSIDVSSVNFEPYHMYYIIVTNGYYGIADSATSLYIFGAQSVVNVSQPSNPVMVNFMIVRDSGVNENKSIIINKIEIKDMNTGVSVPIKGAMTKPGVISFSPNPIKEKSVIKIIKAF